MSDFISREAAIAAVAENDVAGAIRNIRAMPAAPVPVEGLLRCEGCGNVTEDDARDLAWIRRHGGISCCPERKMVPIIPAAPAVKVKPLVWVKGQTMDGRSQWQAGYGACVTVMENGRFRAFNARAEFELRLDAFVAEEDFHRTRILAALEGGE